jgi:hypothetical protein
MTSFHFWKRWLFVASFIVVGMGILIALFNGTFLFAWMNNVINPPFWPEEGLVTPAIHSYQQFIMGLLGVMMACWGLMIAFVAYFPFARLEKWAWVSIFMGLAIWFPIDTGVSLLYHVYFNAIGNLGFLALFLLPLLCTYKNFFPSKISRERA